MYDKYYWYLGNGKYLEGKEAYDHVRSLNTRLTDLRSRIIRKLDDTCRYITECEVNDKNNYEAIYADVMNIGEACSNTMIMLELLIEEINEEMNQYE